MSDTQVELTNPVDHSVGGMGGHILRRSIHLAIAGIPWLYFTHGEAISDLISINAIQLVSLVVLGLVVFEAVRLKIGFTVFGQRDYEAKQVSALAWGGVAIGIALLALREPDYAYPLIVSLALGDPVLGELRRKEFDTKIVVGVATLALFAVWISYAVLFETSLIIAILLPGVCVAAEWPRLRWIDDNATMIFIPLMLLLVLIPLVG